MELLNPRSLQLAHAILKILLTQGSSHRYFTWNIFSYIQLSACLGRNSSVRAGVRRWLSSCLQNWVKSWITDNSPHVQWCVPGVNSFSWSLFIPVNHTAGAGTSSMYMKAIGAVGNCLCWTFCSLSWDNEGLPWPSKRYLHLLIEEMAIKPCKHYFLGFAYLKRIGRML